MHSLYEGCCLYVRFCNLSSVEKCIRAMLIASMEELDDGISKDKQRHTSHRSWQPVTDGPRAEPQADVFIEAGQGGEHVAVQGAPLSR